MVGVAALGMILLRIDRGAVSHALRAADWNGVFVAAALFSLHLALKAVRWKFILDYSGICVPLRKTMAAYFAGALLGTVTPGRMGEFSKAAFIRGWQPGTSWGTAMGVTLLDRFIDVGVLALAALAGAVWWLVPVAYRGAGEAALMIALVLGAVIGLRSWRRLYDSAPGRRARLFLSGKLGSAAGDFYRSLGAMGGRGAWRIVGWTAAAHLLYFLHFYCLGRAMGSPLAFGVLAWGIALASLGAILPLSISGIGIRDAILLAVFTAHGELPARTLAISLAYLAILYVVIPMLAAWPLLKGKIHIRDA